MSTLFYSLLSFLIPALLSHFGVTAVLSRWMSGTTAAAGTRAAGAAAAQLIQNIIAGGEATPARPEGVPHYTPPKLDPTQPPGPVEWTTPKQ